MRILSFGQLIPFESIPVAGGQFYFEHVRALEAMGHEVTVVAPLMTRHAGPRALELSPFQVHAIDPRPRWLHVALRQFDRFFTGGLAPDYVRRVLSDPVILQLVRDADMIEYQWVESMALARFVEPMRGRPGPSVGIVHDELNQRERRRRSAARGHRKVLRTLDQVQAQWRERRAFSQVTDIVAISHKDAIACREVTASARVHVLLPPVVSDETRPAVHRGQGRNDVLMVGAMSRPENEEGAVWFLTQVWPRVRATGPGSASLTIAGASPSQQLLAAAEGSEGVRVTGFVPDLGDLYSQSDVVVVPLLSGAGVKFKTVEGLAHGLPVVSTSVGAEGILEDETVASLVVVDSPNRFADSVVQALQIDQAQVERAAAVGLRVRREYGRATYRDRLGSLLEIIRAGDSRRAR